MAITIEEAVEILQGIAVPNQTAADHDVRMAILLGIQALKRHKSKSTLTFAGMLEPLPGEKE